jgi:hypothetical protein
MRVKMSKTEIAEDVWLKVSDLSDEEKEEVHQRSGLVLLKRYNPASDDFEYHLEWWNELPKIYELCNYRVVAMMVMDGDRVFSEVFKD